MLPTPQKSRDSRLEGGKLESKATYKTGTALEYSTNIWMLVADRAKRRAKCCALMGIVWVYVRFAGHQEYMSF